MAREYGEFASELQREWSDDAARVAAAAAEELAVEVQARRAMGRAVRAARKSAALTQVQLAKLASIEQAEISRIERGHANPTVATLARIGAATGTSVSLA